MLVHPFRTLMAHGVDPPTWVQSAVVGLLKEHHVAAELSFNNHRPNPEFYRRCIDEGVKLSLGSDAHNLCDVGELTPHMRFLDDLGVDGDMSDILLPLD